VREQQLASSVSAFNYTPTELGVFVMFSEGDPARADEAATVMWQVLASMRREGVADGEVVRAQRLFESRWLRRLETMEGQANFLAEWEGLGDWQLGDAYASRMMSATAAEVTDAVRRHLDPAQASVLVHRPAKSPAFASDGPAAFARLDAAPASHIESITVTQAEPPAMVGSRMVAERSVGETAVFRTARGVPILVRRKPGAPVVHLGVYTLSGAAADPAARAGLAALAARTMVKGTMRRTADALALECELLGGSISPAVSSDGTGWTISVPGTHVPAALDLLSDVILDATLADDALETERRVGLQQLAQLRDDMFRYPVRLATEAAYAPHPYGRGILGSEETLNAVTGDDARGWHRALVDGSSAVIAVVGDVDPAAVAARVAAAFHRLQWAQAPALAPVAWPDARRERVEYRDKAQTALALGFPSPARGDDRRFAAHLLAGIASGLGGRFFDELRDRQSLAYTVHATASERLAAGMFIAYIATSPAKEEVARAGLLHEFARLREDRVTEEELARARTFTLGTWAISRQSGASVLAELVDAWLYGEGLEEIDRFAEQVRGVSAESIRELARAEFDESRRVEGIVRGEGRTV
jgi:zinc protease